MNRVELKKFVEQVKSGEISKSEAPEISRLSYFVSELVEKSQFGDVPAEVQTTASVQMPKPADDGSNKYECIRIANLLADEGIDLVELTYKYLGDRGEVSMTAVAPWVLFFVPFKKKSKSRAKKKLR